MVIPKLHPLLSGPVCFLAPVLLLVACFTHAGHGTEHSLPSGTKPNIIFILADDLGYGDLSSYGQKKFTTPNIDRLADEGMLFTNHYAGSSICAPARCVLLTGLHTGRAHIRGNARQGDGVPLREEDLTIAEVLQKVGYTTGGIGKWGLGINETSGAPNKKGFDYWYGFLNQRNAHFFYAPYLWRNDKKEFLPGNDRDAQVGQYVHDLMTREALEFIQDNKNSPFFLYLPYTIPHAELEVPFDSLEPFLGKFPEQAYETAYYNGQLHPLASYAGMITRLDRDVGHIIDLIDALHLSENTLIIFTSDNGPHDVGGANPEFFNSGGGLRGIKRDLYEGGIRVPFLARWTGYIEPGTVSDHVSTFWDFPAMAAEIAGTPWPARTDGISYLPELLGREQPTHDYLYWEFHERETSNQAVRMGKWKGIRHDPDGPIELYNLDNDPGESDNLASPHTAIVAQIEALMVEAREPSEYWPLKTREAISD